MRGCSITGHAVVGMRANQVWCNPATQPRKKYQIQRTKRLSFVRECSELHRHCLKELKTQLACTNSNMKLTF